jgi:serine/threonine-protein kinase
VVDAGAVEAEDAGAVAQAPVVDAGEPEPVKARPARLELRIRPYATVYLDGKKLGDTPLKVQVVKAGKHTLRLVNPKLGKDEEIELVLKPGHNVYKHNLKL